MNTPMHDYPCLDHPDTRRLLEALAGGPATTGELSGRLGLGRHGAEHRLSTLRLAGLTRRIGDTQSSVRGVAYVHEITPEGRRVLERDAAKGGAS